LTRLQSALEDHGAECVVDLTVERLFPLRSTAIKGPRRRAASFSCFIIVVISTGLQLAVDGDHIPGKDPRLSAHQHHAGQHCQCARSSSRAQPLVQYELGQQSLQDETRRGAGTAKLSGSVCTNAINEKNDTALQAMPRISKRRWAITCSNRAKPRALTDCSPAASFRGSAAGRPGRWRPPWRPPGATSLGTLRSRIARSGSHQDRAGKDQQRSQPALMGDRLMQKHFAEEHGDHVTDRGKREGQSSNLPG